MGPALITERRVKPYLRSSSTWGVSLFNLYYVALSHSQGRKTIRILREFDEKWLKRGHDEHLLLKDNRLDATTARWWKMVKR
jgi:hypothetical protein